MQESTRSKLVIACDLHDVIADWVGAIIGIHGWPDRMIGRIWDWYDDSWSEAEWKDWFGSSQYAGFLERLQPITGAGDGLVALSRLHTVWILTAAPKNGPGRRATHDWLFRSGKLPLDVNTDAIWLRAVGSIEAKVEWLQNNARNIDWLIDDSPEVLLKCDEVGVNSARFFAPWNAHISSNVTFRTWKDIRRFFLGGDPFWPRQGPARAKYLSTILEE